MSRKGILTFEERVLIEKYIKKGFSLSEISKVIGRGGTTIAFEVRRSGGRDNYCSSTAQSLSEERHRNKSRKLSILNEGEPKVFIFKQRIENLEMQVEILSETIKEMLKK